MTASVVLNSDRVFFSLFFFQESSQFPINNSPRIVEYSTHSRKRDNASATVHYICRNNFERISPRESGLLASKLGKKPATIQCRKLAESRRILVEILSWRGSNEGGVSNHLANHASQPPAHPATRTSRCSSVYQTCRNRVPAWFLRACTGVANST